MQIIKSSDGEVEVRIEGLETDPTRVVAIRVNGDEILALEVTAYESVMVDKNYQRLQLRFKQK